MTKELRRLDLADKPDKQIKLRNWILGSVTCGLIVISGMGLAGCSLAAANDSKAPSSSPTHPASSAVDDFNEAETLRASSQCDRAVPLYLSAINKNGMYVSAYNGLGFCYQILGMLNAAIVEYDKAIQIDPTNYGLYIARAGIEANNGSTGAAAADDAIAMRLAPAQALSYVAIANSFASYADFADAVKAFDAAIALIPNNPSLYEQRATIYLQMQDTTRAYADYQHAISVSPTKVVRATVYSDLAGVYSGQGDSDSALRAISTAIQLLPNDARFYVVSGNIHRDASSLALALKLYNHALRLVKQGSDALAAHEGKGDVYVKLNQTRAGVAEYRMARKLAAKGDVSTKARLDGKIKAALSGQS